MKKNYKRNWLFKFKSAFVVAFFLFSGTAMAQLSGTYTIDKGSSASATNFTSFKSFASAVSRGVTGPVTVNVAKGSGPYSEWVEFGNITGTSSTNTVTVNGNGNTITHAGSSSRSPVFTFKSTDYFTLDNLIIENRKKEVKVKNKRKIQKKKRLSFERERRESNESVDGKVRF